MNISAEQAAKLFSETYPYVRNEGIWTGDELIQAFEIVHIRKPAGNLLPVRNRLNGKLGSIAISEFYGHKIYHSFREI